MLATFGQELGLDREMALKVAGAFGEVWPAWVRPAV